MSISSFRNSTVSPTQAAESKGYHILNLPEDVIGELVNRLDPPSRHSFTFTCKKFFRYLDPFLEANEYTYKCAQLGYKLLYQRGLEYGAKLYVNDLLLAVRQGYNFATPTIDGHNLRRMLEEAVAYGHQELAKEIILMIKSNDDSNYTDAIFTGHLRAGNPEEALKTKSWMNALNEFCVKCRKENELLAFVEKYPLRCKKYYQQLISTALEIGSVKLL